MRRRPGEVVAGVLVALALYGATAAYLHGQHLGVHTGPAFNAALAAVPVALLAHVVVHEFGHLVAALLLGVRVRSMRVSGVRIFGPVGPGRTTTGPISYVDLDLDRRQRLLAPRMAAIAVAGPLVNLAIAAVALAPVVDQGASWQAKAVAMPVGLTGALIGLGNLVPFRTGISHSDGRNVLRWTVGARRHLAELEERRAGRSIASGEGGGVLTPAEALDSDRPDVAGAAMARVLSERLRDARPGELRAVVWDLYDGLLRVVGMPGVEPRYVRALTITASRVLSIECAQQEIRYRRPHDAGRAARIEALIDAGRTVAPDDLRLRTALGVVRIVQGRVDEAAGLLVGVSPGDDAPDRVADAYAVRALAEIGRGDLAQARRLIGAAQRESSDRAMTRLAGDVLSAAERRRSG